MLCSLLAATRLVADDGILIRDGTGTQIGNFVQAAHRTYGFSGAVLAARDGEVLCAVAVGDLGDPDETPISTTTLFEIASATKPFAAIAALILEEQGELSLDDPISKHLPGVPEDCSEITVQHLIQHSSGIPGTNTRGRGDDFAVVVPQFLKDGPKHKPGTHWEYWNQGYSLLSEVIARASGKSYVDFTRDAIFDKAGMRTSCFTGDDAPDGVTVAIGRAARHPRSALEPPYGPTYGYEYRGMGGLVTSVWDLWRFDRAMAEEKLLSKATIDRMVTPGVGGFGLGWKLGRTRDGKAFHHHGGSVRGFLADMHRFPSFDGCLYVLSNNDDRQSFFRVAGGCRQLLLGEKEQIDLPGPLAADLLTAICGKYQDDKRRTMTIERSGEIAKVTIYWGGPVTRALIGADDAGDPHLYEPSGATPMTFDVKDGEAKRCKFLTLDFARVEP